MYSLEQLEQKNIKQLKEIGHQLNVLPAADRRCRQNWIDAIVGVNPPLLQLLEASPAVSVEQVQEPIAPAATIFSTNDRVCVHSGLFSGMTGRVMRGSTSYTIRVEFDRRYEPSGAYFAFIGRDCLTLLEPVVDELTVSAIEVQVRERKEVSPGVEVEQVQEAIAQAAEIPPGVDPGVDVDRVQKPIAPAVEIFPGVEVDSVQEPIAQVGLYSPGVDVDYIESQLQEPLLQASPGACDCPFCGAQHGLFIDRDHMDRFVIRCLHCGNSKLKTYPGAITTLAQESVLLLSKSGGTFCKAAKPIEIQRQEPIAPAAKNPILTGVTFSDRFLARYSPPQAQIIHFQSDADGQLSLLDFEVQSVDEPPDPDDFESLDAFREALARWNGVHLSSFDHFSDLPSSEHSELNSEYSESLEVSLDSFCEWAPCPADWYEPAELLEPSSMLELSPTRKSFITSDFFIPTFDCLGDRSNKSDEPPDTGIYARLPKSKPPSFPPTAVSQARVKRGLNAYQTHPESIPKVSRKYPESIPKVFRTHTHCIVVGSSTQPARSPPFGDAGF